MLAVVRQRRASDQNRFVVPNDSQSIRGATVLNLTCCHVLFSFLAGGKGVVCRWIMQMDCVQMLFLVFLLFLVFWWCATGLRLGFRV